MTQPARIGRPTRAEAAELEMRLRRAALDVFLDRGFEAASMEEIARAAGISKRTLYAKYPEKRALFVKVLTWAMSNLQWREPRLPAGRGASGLRAELLAIGRAVVARLRDPELTRLSRMAMAEAHRFPEFQFSAQSLAWSPRMQTLMDVLRQHADDGDITVGDVELAAEQFLTLVGGMTSRLSTFGVRRTEAEEQRHLVQAVDLFLRGVLPR